MFHDWLGMRPEDLSLDEQDQLDADLSLAAMHRAELQLGLQLVDLPTTGRVITMADVREFGATLGETGGDEVNTTFRLVLYGATVLAVVMVGLSFFGGRAPEVSEEGVTLGEMRRALPTGQRGDPDAFGLSASAFYAGEMRTIQAGQSFQFGEEALLEIDVRGSGYCYLGIEGQDDTLFPMGGAHWFVTEGSWPLGGSDGQPLVTIRRPDESVVTLGALLCTDPVDGGYVEPAPEGCLHVTKTLRWD